jgi:hypothetical protein
MHCSHEIEDKSRIEQHANHRPPHYTEQVNPIIFGLFSKSVKWSALF